MEMLNNLFLALFLISLFIGVPVCIILIIVALIRQEEVKPRLVNLGWVGVSIVVFFVSFMMTTDPASKAEQEREAKAVIQAEGEQRLKEQELDAKQKELEQREAELNSIQQQLDIKEQQSIKTADTQQSFSTPMPRDVFRQGESAQSKDIQVTLLGYRESNGNEWIKPADGKVFLQAEFEIVNNSNQDETISSIINFNAYCDDYSLEYSFGATAMDSVSQLDGTISPGKRLRGYIGWEVPKNWGNVEIHFTDNVWSDRKVKFLIER